MIKDRQMICFYICTIIIAVIAGAVYLYTAIHLPVYDKYSIPDEICRRMIPFYIVKNGVLPTGYETALNAANSYGFSYASYPPFPALVSAFFIKTVSFFSSNDRLLIIASRLGNVFFGVFSSIFMMKLGYCFFGNIMAAVLCTVLVSFMPQVIFISSYYNADSFSLFSVIMILYYLLVGKKDGWKSATCLKLSIAMSVCVLTYYNAYSFCLAAVLFCVLSCLQDRSLNAEEKTRLIVSRSIQCMLVIVLLTGWYFIRNYILYDGDFLAVSIRKKIAEMTYEQGYPVYSCKPFANTGKSLLQMLFTDNGYIEITFKSMICVLGAMDIYISSALYFIFGFILVSGLMCSVYYCIKDRKNHLFYLSVISASVITFSLSVFYSYKIDYQPQGRYIISMLPGIAIFSVIGYRQIVAVIYDLLRKMKFGSYISIGTLSGIFMKFILILWLFLLVHIYYSTAEDKVFVHDRLCYEMVNSGREISFHYIQSELNSYNAVNFAIWRPRENASPLWFAAENTDSDWELSWKWDSDGSDGDYAVHVYGICKDGKYRKLSESKFAIRDNVICIER